MRVILVVSILGCMTGAALADAPTALWLHAGAAPAEGGNASLRVIGPDARRQLLATATLAGGALRDVTRDVTYEVTPASIVQVDKAGMLSPLGDGTATVTAKYSGGPSASLSVTVEQFGTSKPVNFPNQVVPIFTKNGCNGGGCHGKSSGQNGFKLSLLGFEPTEDFEHLTKEARGRRLFPAAPDRSLLLLKATATLPHGGDRKSVV